MFSVLTLQRFERRLLKIGPEPAGFNKRREYDKRLDCLVDNEVLKILREIRRERRYHWVYAGIERVKALFGN